MNEIIVLLEKFGFPIVAYLLLFWLNVKVISDNTKAINKLSQYIYETKNNKSS